MLLPHLPALLVMLTTATGTKWQHVFVTSNISFGTNQSNGITVERKTAVCILHVRF